MSFRSAFAVLLCASLLAVGGDAMAQTVAGADFNGDGFADLAVGVPGEDIANPDTVADAGVVHVIYGAAGSGLSSLGSQLWTQDSPDVADSAEAGDRFGAALAWGDFNADGFSDLAVGAPGEDVDGIADAGVVHVLYGSAVGLSAVGNQVWSMQSPDVPGDAEAGTAFGWSLTAGDFNGDGVEDLAIGAIGDWVAFRPRTIIAGAGSVNVLYGSLIGLTTTSAETWNQQTPSVTDRPETNDQFGWALAAGDFDGDGFDDLAIGVPFEDGSVSNSGFVHVLRGTIAGITAIDSLYYLQGQGGLPDKNCPNPSKKETCQEPQDMWGYALATADFNGDGFEDLAIGVPGEDLTYYTPDTVKVVNAGQAHVLYGSATGLVKVGSQLWNEDVGTVQDTAEFNDQFGTSLAASDFDGNGFADLAVGAPGERLEGPTGSVKEAGQVHVLYGTANKIRAQANQVWNQDTPTVADTAEVSDFFGTTLATGDFDGDGRGDLAIGTPSEDVDGPSGTVADAGGVNVLYGTANRLKADRNQLWTQETPGVDDDAEAGDGLAAALSSP